MAEATDREGETGWSGHVREEQARHKGEGGAMENAGGLGGSSEDEEGRNQRG